jgi:hypothetical protein
MDIVFVGESDPGNSIGVKGIGETGLVGVAAAIAKRRLPRHRPAHPLAAHHHRATSRRQRLVDTRSTLSVARLWDPADNGVKAVVRA